VRAIGTGVSSGPIRVACQWNISSPTGPALQLAGGSFPRSHSSLLILFIAIVALLLFSREGKGWEGKARDGKRREERRGELKGGRLKVISTHGAV
jgi:hypothetical protein